MLCDKKLKINIRALLSHDFCVLFIITPTKITKTINTIIIIIKILTLKLIFETLVLFICISPFIVLFHWGSVLFEWSLHVIKRSFCAWTKHGTNSTWLQKQWFKIWGSHKSSIRSIRFLIFHSQLKVQVSGIPVPYWSCFEHWNQRIGRNITPWGWLKTSYIFNYLPITIIFNMFEKNHSNHGSRYIYW